MYIFFIVIFDLYSCKRCYKFAFSKFLNGAQASKKFCNSHCNFSETLK